MSATGGGHYSGSNPIPTINKLIESLDKDKKQRDAQIDEAQKLKKTAAKGGAVQTPATTAATPHVNETPKKAEGQKVVTDPVTGGQVTIENASKDTLKQLDNPTLSVPNANLGRDATVKTEAGQANPDYAHNLDVTAPPDPIAEGSTTDVPIKGEKTSILFHPTPSLSYEPTIARIETQAWGVITAVFVAIIVVGRMFGGRFLGLIPLAMCVSSGVWLWMKELARSLREVEWDSEQVRGKTATAALVPESVEWLNTLMGCVWGLINPDMFQSVADTIEDVMQASVPGIIENVRIAEINQGSNPLRILSLRSLPDSHVKDIKAAIHEENKKTKDPQEAAADEEGGTYYNLEASVAYHASPTGKRTSDKARNMHMQLVFYLGVKGFFGVPLPIFVELQSLVVTVRFRLAMTPEPPFLKTMTMTLMGVPQVEAGCVPMMEKGPNILNLPLISNFVQYAIAAAASMYVAPKSLSLDMRAMLQGDSIQKDVQAMGVLFIRLHRAVGLSKQDRRGSKHGGSDPYIVIAFSKFQKPLYCTRVITDDLNPLWEESCAILVTPEVIKADEKLSVELWDSDRHSADDIVGKVELSMQKMIQHPGKMFPQCSKLAGMDEGSDMPGELHWEIGYFGKPQFRPALRTDGKDKTLPKELQDKPELQDEKGVANTAQDDAVQHTPPDPLWPSGVCSVIVHQIVNLELENIKGSEGNRKGREYEPAKGYGENTEEQGKDLPTSYCTIHYNDELMYKTRSKAVSSQPIFEAGTERWISDWRSGIITVAVRDSRNREHDPLLGIVPLKISDILATSSQVTRWYPLDGGVGFGRVRISLLFRSVETRLPPNMLGWSVGTFQFASERILATGYDKNAKLKLRTGGSSGKIPRSACSKLPEGDGMFWDLTPKEGEHQIQLPVKYRYRSPIVFEFHISGKRKADAYAVIWLQHLIDNEDTPINIPIWTTKSPHRLTQNYITEANCKGELGLEDLEEVGRLQFRGKFKAGMDESHMHFIEDNDSRETYETWEACLAEGVRHRHVEKEVPELVQDLHEKSLTQGRDILKHAPVEDQEKWTDADGTDWSGAFGQNPKAYMDTKGRKRREPGADEPIHDPYHPSDDERNDPDTDYDSDDSSSSSQPDLGLEDADTAGDASNMDGSSKKSSAGRDSSVSDGTTLRTTDTNSSLTSKEANKQNKRSEQRKQRGLMQWKPARNLKFAKDESKIGLRKLKNKITGADYTEGRKPDVETETGV